MDIQNLSRSAPVAFIGKELASLGGRSVVLIRNLSMPAIAILTLALAVLAGVAYIFRNMSRTQVEKEGSSSILEQEPFLPAVEESLPLVLDPKPLLSMEGKQVTLALGSLFNDAVSIAFDELVEQPASRQLSPQLPSSPLLEEREEPRPMHLDESLSRSFRKDPESISPELLLKELEQSILSQKNGKEALLHDSTSDDERELSDSISEGEWLLNQLKDLSASRQQLNRSVFTPGLDLSAAIHLERSPFEPQQDLSDSWAIVGTDADRAQSLINEGKEILNRVLNGEDLEAFIAEIKNSNQGMHQASVIHWFLMSIAKQKGQDFDEGSFICKDPDGKLTQFLTAIATPRVSSHLKGVADAQHYGIDMHIEYEQYNHKRHLLVAAIDQDQLGGKRVFIKPENYGVTTWFDLYGHSIEYIESLERKIKGGDDADNFRKERVPQDLLKEFSKIIGKQPGIIAEAKKFGVSAMHGFVKGNADYQQFQQKLEELGDVDVRFGREIVIDNLAELVALQTE